LAGWISGSLVVRDTDGSLRRKSTLNKLAWCVALLGYDLDTVKKAVIERDQQPEYRCYTDLPSSHRYQTYRKIARRAIGAHVWWARQQEAGA
jgi:hypothetical protein